MLAKLAIPIPFEIALPEAVEYRLFSFRAEGYEIRFDIPGRLEKPPTSTRGVHVLLDEKPAIQADVLRIEFKKEIFERRENEPMDPPEEIIRAAVEYFIGRLRYAANAFQVQPLKFPKCAWSLVYLNDDGTDLTAQPGHLRMRSSLKNTVSVLACDARLWEFIFTLPPKFEPPAWHTLLLDSRASLPHVGTAVVLATTALEVFIGALLTELSKGISMPDLLWEWINERDNDHYKQPSVAEQFDTLLKVMTGRSLKEEVTLWEAFRKLKNARNNFVHRGIARTGSTASELSDLEALALVGQAEGIVAKIREWIPEELRWPMFTSNTKIQFTLPLIPQIIREPSKVALSPVTAVMNSNATEEKPLG